VEPDPAPPFKVRSNYASGCHPQIQRWSDAGPVFAVEFLHAHARRDVGQQQTLVARVTFSDILYYGGHNPLIDEGPQGAYAYFSPISVIRPFHPCVLLRRRYSARLNDRHGSEADELGSR